MPHVANEDGQHNPGSIERRTHKKPCCCSHLSFLTGLKEERSAFGWAKKGVWRTTGTTDERERMLGHWFLVGFEPLFADFTQSGSWYAVYVLIEVSKRPRSEHPYAPVVTTSRPLAPGSFLETDFDHPVSTLSPLDDGSPLPLVLSMIPVASAYCSACSSRACCFPLSSRTVVRYRGRRCFGRPQPVAAWGLPGTWLGRICFGVVFQALRKQVKLLGFSVWWR